MYNTILLLVLQSSHFKATDSIRALTGGGHAGLHGGQVEAVVDVGGQQVVAAVLVLVPLQVLVDLVDQQRHGLERRPAQVD